MTATRRLRDVDPTPTKSEIRDAARKVKERSPMRELRSTKRASPEDPVLREREARRKEIQSLINKYVMLDEAYGKVGKSVTREKTVKAAATQTAAVPVRQPKPQPVPQRVRARPAVSRTPSCG